jgi:hypothetical protein
MAHLANCSDSGRKRMKDLHRWAETAYERPISISILFKSVLSFLKELKDIIGRFGELKLVGERIVSEVDTGFLGIVDKGIEDQLEGRRRNG